LKHLRDDIAIKNFGEKLKEIRQSKGFSQEKLAWEANIEPMQISRIERGIINTSLSQITNLANALKISPAEFFNTPT
jgi:transcriptional regulator with XRE-family HTH domain